MFFEPMPKHKGNICDYRDERDRFLLSTKRKLYSMVAHIDTPEILRTLVKMPAPRLWISEQTAEVVVDRMTKGTMDLDRCHKERRRLYEYLFKRYNEERLKRPEEKTSLIIFDIIYSPAPESFISEKSIASLMTRYRMRSNGIEPNIMNGRSNK